MWLREDGLSWRAVSHGNRLKNSAIVQTCPPSSVTVCSPRAQRGAGSAAAPVRARDPAGDPVCPMSLSVVPRVHPS